MECYEKCGGEEPVLQVSQTVLFMTSPVLTMVVVVRVNFRAPHRNEANMIGSSETLLV